MADQNRLAEIALELFGARAASEFLREAWEAADPEGRRALGDAILEQARAALADPGPRNDWKKNTWDARAQYDRAVFQLVEKLLKEEMPQLESMLREYIAGDEFKEKLRQQVMSVAEKTAARALGIVSSEIGERIAKKERGY